MNSTTPCFTGTLLLSPDDAERLERAAFRLDGPDEAELYGSEDFMLCGPHGVSMTAKMVLCEYEDNGVYVEFDVATYGFAGPVRFSSFSEKGVLGVYHHRHEQFEIIITVAAPGYMGINRGQ
jgi:hypothetical protein